MKRFQSISNVFFLSILFSPLLVGADLSSYRGFQFGMTLNAAVKHSGLNSSEATITHDQPALIQELSWRPSRFSSNETDPVEKISLSFYNRQLFRISIDYNPDKTNGMKPEDLVDAMSVQYGTARSAATTLFPLDSKNEGITVLARWEDADNSLNLVQSSFSQQFGLVFFSKRLDELAQLAIANGTHLEKQGAPQRQKIEEQDAQEKLNKARLANRSSFRP